MPINGKGTGVDMEIKNYDTSAWTALINANKHDQMSASFKYGCSTALTFPPSRIITRRYSKHNTNYTRCNDPVYDELYSEFLAASNAEEQRQAIIKANDRALEQHFSIHVLPEVLFHLYQPWFKGFTGENASSSSSFHYARFWIDQDLKKSMGH